MKKAKKLTALLLAAALTAGSFTIPASADNSELQPASVSVYPTPQTMSTDSEEGMSFEGTVDLVIHGAQDEATLPKLEAMLAEENISYAAADAVGSNAAIVLATSCGEEDCELCSSLTDSADALSEEQGYVLKSSNDTNKKGQVTIVGADADGTYYGVMTLLQMFKQKTSDGRIAEVTISDYPDIKFRGYVEGFYGFPWSFNDRKELFEDTTMYKMNTYIYAPKDDPYHRDSWRTLYPEQEAEDLTKLVDVARENNMEFCWTIHPGADYSYSGTTDYDKLIAKLEQVYSFGIRQFGIFYDDLSYSVANGTQHATVINNVYEYMQNKYGDIKPFITVLTRYTNSWGADTYSYFKPFMQNINEDTIVLWTGNSTMSAITYDYFEWPQTQSGVDRDFGVWWNYPVNDYCDGHLLMSPLHCLDNDVTNISTFFLNPMSEADASKVAIYSGADYSWNMEDFDSQTSWERAIWELVPEANKEFERFADNIGFVSEGSGFVFDESVYLKEDLTAFEAAVYSGEGLAELTASLKASFEQIVADADVLKTIKDAELLEEITVHVDAYKVLGQAGVSLMESYEAALAGNIETCISKMGEADDLLQDSTKFTVPVYDNGRTVQVRAYVGSHTLVPFMERCITNVMMVLSDNLSAEQDAKLQTSVEGLEAEVIVTDDTYSVENISAAMNKDDYVAIALPKASVITDITADAEPADALKVQYSLNGIEWKDYTSEGSVKGTYVRVLCTADNTEVKINVLSAAVENTKEVQPVNPVITSDMTTYLSYSISKAIDGNLNSYYWTSHGSSVGNYIQVDFGTETTLNSVELYTAINNKGVLDCFSTTQLQVSSNGATWTDVGGDNSLEDYVAAENGLYKLKIETGGIKTRFFRFKATSNSESWLQLYELTWDIDHEAVERTITTNMGTYSTYSIGNAMDGSMETKYYSSDATTAGDYIQVDLGKETSLENATIFFGGNPNTEATAVDGFNSTKLQVSTDGSTWTDAAAAISYTEYVHMGEGRYAAAFDIEGGVAARYVRFTADSAGDNWVQVYEVGFNDISFLEGTASVGQSSYIDDGDIASAPVIYNVENGDTLIYPMTTITDVATIGIYQDRTAISNAAVSVQKLDGSWTEVGTLDEAWNSFSIQDTILAVKLTFDGTVDPVIYEIVVTEIGSEQPTPEVTETPDVTEVPDVTETPDVTEAPENKENVTDVFDDVYSDWYVSYVQYVYDNGLMTGIKGTNNFEPNANITKAQVAQVLYNMEGQPTVDDMKVFTELNDVYAAEWYANAVAWAFNTGVVTGDLNTKKFSPNADVTREQLALMIFRYAQYKEYDTSASSDLAGLANAENTSNWAADGVKWAVGAGLISGIDKGTVKDLAPQGNASRAQVAAILQRFCENVK